MGTLMASLFRFLHDKLGVTNAQPDSTLDRRILEEPCYRRRFSGRCCRFVLLARWLLSKPPPNLHSLEAAGWAALHCSYCFYVLHSTGVTASTKQAAKEAALKESSAGPAV